MPFFVRIFQTDMRKMQLMRVFDHIIMQKYQFLGAYFDISVCRLLSQSYRLLSQSYRLLSQPRHMRFDVFFLQILVPPLFCYHEHNRWRFKATLELWL